MDIKQMQIEKEKAQDEIRDTLVSFAFKTGVSIASLGFDVQRGYEVPGRVVDFGYAVEIHCEL